MTQSLLLRMPLELQETVISYVGHFYTFLVRWCPIALDTLAHT